jgi:multiple sugar transport system permease protein/raffinose/stachyose/melibiose transport system permease protein
MARWLLLVPVLAYTVFSAGPYVWTAMMSLRTTDEIYRSHYGLPIPAHWAKYHRAWTEFGYATYFRNSAIVTVAAVILVTVLGAMAAFAFARRRYAFPGREPLFLLVFLSIMFPPQIMLLALFQILVQYRLFNTLTGLVLVYAATELPLTIYLLRAFFAQIPTELEEAARIDGCSQLEAFWRILLPLSTPALAIVFLFNFLAAWNDYFLARILLTKQELLTWPLGLTRFQAQFQTQWNDLAASSIIISIPVVALFLYSSKWLVSGVTAGGVKG